MTGMTVTGRLELVALDAADIVGLASFYAELTGWQTVRNVDGWRFPDPGSAPAGAVAARATVASGPDRHHRIGV
jgi:hypothetical protein